MRFLDYARNDIMNARNDNMNARNDIMNGRNDFKGNYPKIASKNPAAIALPITPETLGPIACINK